MADLSKIKIPNGTEYNLKDAQARADIESLNGSLGDVKADLDATNGDINKLIGNVQGTWNLGGMYAATGIDYNSSNRIKTPFIKVNPGDTIQIENPDTTLQLSIYEFASNAPTASGTNERLQITYADSSVKKVTLGNSTNYIRLQLPTEDTLKGDDLLLYTKNSVVFKSITEVSENLSETLEQEVYPVNKQIFYDLLSYLHPDFTSIRGVLCVKQEDGTYSISGTVTSGTSAIIFNIFSNKTSFPKGITAGGRYRIFARTNSFLVRVIYYTSASDNGTALLSKSGAFIGDEITIPSNATGLSIRFQYTSPVEGTVFNETKLGIILVPGHELANYARAGIANNNKAKIYALGNSFMGGAVWINNAYNHLVEYNNSIYGQIAASLNVSQENVDFTMHSSTGLISPSSSYPGFIDTITGVNLAPYDYLLTQMNSSDIRKTGVQLGSENSSDNDGTLAGSVIHLINYIKTSNGKCKLILLSVPPYSSNPVTSGNNVFSGVWSNGYSIDDLDTVMYKLARKYHFIYISWQDLEISYHYMDYADYVEGETTPRHASDDSVYRVIGEYAAMQIKAVSSPIAIGKLLN